MYDIASRPLLVGADLDAAVDHARAALAALLRAPDGGAGDPKALAEARALLGALLGHRVALAAAPVDEPDAAAAAAARADRGEGIAVTAALLSSPPAAD